jgi:hypothetical protein
MRLARVGDARLRLPVLDGVGGGAPGISHVQVKKSKLETSIGDIPVNELNQNESGAQFASLAFAVGGDLGTATESEQAAINCGGCNTCSSCGQGGCSGCGSCSAEEEEEEGAIDP